MGGSTVVLKALTVGLVLYTFFLILRLIWVQS